MQPQYAPTHNLNLLRILYIVKACFNFVGAVFFTLYAFLGSFINALMDLSPDNQQHDQFPDEAMWLFAAVGIFGAFVFFVMGTITLIAASKIKARKSYNFIFAAAIINCFTGMLGIALGVFTIVELNKPEVKALFQRNREPSTEF